MQHLITRSAWQKKILKNKQTNSQTSTATELNQQNNNCQRPKNAHSLNTGYFFDFNIKSTNVFKQYTHIQVSVSILNISTMHTFINCTASVSFSSLHSQQGYLTWQYSFLPTFWLMFYERYTVWTTCPMSRLIEIQTLHLSIVSLDTVTVPLCHNATHQVAQGTRVSTTYPRLLYMPQSMPAWVVWSLMGHYADCSHWYTHNQHHHNSSTIQNTR